MLILKKHLQEWFLTSMFAKMEFECFLQSKGFITQGTWVRFNTSVAIHVY